MDKYRQVPIQKVKRPTLAVASIFLSDQSNLPYMLGLLYVPGWKYVTNSNLSENITLPVHLVNTGLVKFRYIKKYIYQTLK